ncbi:MAG: divalent-cation tolerance protein CutA [Candidatus Sungbacteria bacterium]|nr:divalent-cation tolerance protein CutA [Candidatus Sungbacteria bacterium]
MSRAGVILTTCKSKLEAERIGRALLQKRLAACCITIPEASSLYRWPPRFESGRASPRLQRGGKGKIKSAKEVILLVKTMRAKVGAAEREIKKLHSYKIPAIITWSARNVNKIYLQWMKKMIK